jgi:hypothetical protein
MMSDALARKSVAITFAPISIRPRGRWPCCHDPDVGAHPPKLRRVHHPVLEDVSVMALTPWRRNAGHELGLHVRREPGYGTV